MRNFSYLSHIVETCHGVSLLGNKKNAFFDKSVFFHYENTKIKDFILSFL